MKKEPRAFFTYRGARRNAARHTISPMRGRTELNSWRFGPNAARANEAAELPRRRTECASARMAVVNAIANHAHRGTGLRLAAVISKALVDFWRCQKGTRVNHRIIKQLVHARV